MVLRILKGTIIPKAKPKSLADKFLAVPHRYQEQTNWCWAACSEMLYLFFGINTWRQCNIAQACFGGNCCSAPGSAVCNQGNWPENGLNLVSIRWVRQNTAWSFWGVRFEIQLGRPLIVYYEWSGGGAHVAVVRGVYDDTDLDVHDPFYGPGRRTYDSVLHGYGYGNWTKTYTGIER